MRIHISAILALALSSMTAFAQAPAVLPFMDSSLSAEQRVDDLVARLTLEEKASQMMNSAPAIPRLGIPAYDWWNEGLHGVARSGYATLFPQAIGLAATWDTNLMWRVSDAISTEARAKHHEAVRRGIHSIYYGLTIWSPNINIFRDPRWGRGQETYGEDPFLTGRMGVAFIKGLQGSDPNYLKTVATPKHFAVHSGPESERHRFNVRPSVHDLWDTYLPAFRAAIVEGKAYSLMCAYNAVDGEPACGNRDLLENTARQVWGFTGYVTSDCDAINDFYNPQNGHHYSVDLEHAAASGVRAGTELNCGRAYRSLPAAVNKGLISAGELDAALKRLLLARFRLGMFDPDAKVGFASIPFSEVGSAKHQAVALEAARKSIVLLKNQQSLLPLRQDIKTIAVVGPNAASLAALEGNYNAIPRDPIFPVDEIARRFQHSTVLYSQGSPYAEGVALPVPRTVLHPEGKPSVEGLKGEYFATDTLTGEPVVTRIDSQVEFDWNSASPAPGIPADRFAVRWTGTITVPEAGKYDFVISINGRTEKYAVYLDEVPVAGIALASSNSKRQFTLNFGNTKPHRLRVEYQHSANLYDAGITMKWAPRTELLRQEAVALAKKSDVVLAFVGLSPEMEGEEMPLNVEGFSRGDRTDINLPAPQQKLLESLAATGKPLVVVLLNGSALSVNWIQQHATAILEAWYPGQAGAQAIVDTLDGTNNPAGRLPVTFYASVDQLPPFDDYSMTGRTYRYFTGRPLYEFGYGLSYTQFTYSNLKLSASRLAAGDSLSVEADIANSGGREGDEVAQLYLIPPRTEVSPLLALQGFQRVHLKPGETKHVSFILDPRALSQVDAEGVRAVNPGRYRLALGGGQPSTRPDAVTAEFTVEGSQKLPR